MMSWRCPRPIAVMESIALMPVWTGVLTLLRFVTPGAMRSTGSVFSAWIGPLPSSGLPTGSTTRPMSASPTGTSATRPVARTSSPSFTWLKSPSTMMPTFVSSRLSASPITPFGNSTSSPDITFESPSTRAMPSPASSTVPTLVEVTSAPNFSICSFRIDVISSGRTAIFYPRSVLAGHAGKLALERQ